MVVFPAPSKDLKDLFPTIDNVLSHHEVVSEIKKKGYKGLLVRGYHSEGVTHGCVFMPSNEDNKIFIIRNVNNLKKQSEIVVSLRDQIFHMRTKFQEHQLSYVKIEVFVWNPKKNLNLDSLERNVQKDVEDVKISSGRTFQLPLPGKCGKGIFLYFSNFKQIYNHSNLKTTILAVP